MDALSEAGSTAGSTAVASTGMFQTEDLDREKFALEVQRTRDTALMGQLQRKLDFARKSLEAKRAAMSNYESTFLVGGTVKEVQPATKPVKVPTSKRKLYEKSRARFGSQGAVDGTRKIIERHLKQLSKLGGVMDKKLNTAQHRNKQMRVQVDNLRREHLVFDRLFDKLQEEIEGVRASVNETKDSIAMHYKQRDAVRTSIQKELDGLQEAELVAKMEWGVLDKGLQDATNQAEAVVADTAEGVGAGGLTQSEEEALKKQQQQSLWAIGKDKVLLAQLEERRDVFAGALEAIRDGTGFEDLEGFISQMNDFEEQKFGIVSAINKLLGGIEEREARVQAMRVEFQGKEAHNFGVTADKKGALDTLRAERDTARAEVEAQQAKTHAILGDLGVVLQPLQTLFKHVGAKDMFGSEPPIMAQPEESKAASGAASPTTPPRSVVDTSGGVLAEAVTGFDEGVEHIEEGGLSPPLNGSMAMYMASPSLKESVVTGISVNSLAQFTVILEQVSAEIMQKYAIVMSRPHASTTGSATMAALQAQQGSRIMRAARSGSLVPLGPTQGTNTTRSALTSSAIMAALIDTEAMALPEDDADDAAPLSVAQLKAQAAAQLRSKQFMAARQASTQAAKYLVQTQDRKGRK